MAQRCGVSLHSHHAPTACRDLAYNSFDGSIDFLENLVAIAKLCVQQKRDNNCTRYIVSFEFTDWKEQLHEHFHSAL